MMKSVFLLAIAIVFTLNCAVFAAEPCPPNTACSENYRMPIAQDSVPTPEIKKEEKKKPTPEEIAAYQKSLAEASKRDNDLIVVFDDKSLSETCYPLIPIGKYEKWLMKNEDVVVDKKELLFSHFIWGRSANRTGCTTMMVVHYHKKEQK